jgi:hypothetical protein
MSHVCSGPLVPLQTDNFALVDPARRYWLNAATVPPDSNS